jgi:hypothetical protein
LPRRRRFSSDPAYFGLNVTPEELSVGCEIERLQLDPAAEGMKVAFGIGLLLKSLQAYRQEGPPGRTRITERGE